MGFTILIQLLTSISLLITLIAKIGAWFVFKKFVGTWLERLANDAYDKLKERYFK